MVACDIGELQKSEFGWIFLFTAAVLNAFNV
jgi:hypothetical protein